MRTDRRGYLEQIVLNEAGELNVAVPVPDNTEFRYHAIYRVRGIGTAYLLKTYQVNDAYHFYSHLTLPDAEFDKVAMVRLREFYKSVRKLQIERTV
jgi:hypothetical protein